MAIRLKVDIPLNTTLTDAFATCYKVGMRIKWVDGHFYLVG